MALIQSPEKELRFTRSGQAVFFLLLAAAFLTASLIIGVCSTYRDIDPNLPHIVWALLPLGLSSLPIWLAIHLTRHAYIILTPLGVEIFPFFRPATGMNLITWQEIHSVEINENTTRLTLHYNVEKSSGIHLSLRPIHTERRVFLSKAMILRTEKSTTP